MFRELRSFLKNNVDHKRILKNPASALRLTQICHKSKLHQDKNCRNVVTDNFFTLHELAKKLLNIIDGNFKMVGTVRINLVDATNRAHLREAQVFPQKKPQGIWPLCQAFNRGYVVAGNAKYIVNMDKILVTFYCSALQNTPNTPIDYGSNHSFTCLRGLASLHR